MPEQPQWYERTLDMPPQDPWADQPTVSANPPTRPFSPAPGPGQHQTQQHRTQQQHQTQQQAQPGDEFVRGRATVNPNQVRSRYSEHEPTGTGWPGAVEPPHVTTGSWRWSDLRRGGEWTTAAGLFLFVCWGIWAISNGGNLTTPAIVFVITLAVGVGLFCLARVVGHLILERWLGRTRRSARGSHLVTGLFLAGAGIGYLKQVEWVVGAWNWVASSGFFK